jgi:hypothetical protein
LIIERRNGNIGWAVGVRWYGHDHLQKGSQVN